MNWETLRVMCALCGPAIVALLGLMWKSSRASLAQQTTTNVKLQQIEVALVKGEKKFTSYDARFGQIENRVTRVETVMNLEPI